MADSDWIHIGVSAVVSLGSGIGGLMAGLYRAGRKSAQRAQAVKEDYSNKIDGLRDEMRDDMASLERGMTGARDLLADQFKESFNGIRRQIDEHRLHTEEKFVRKDDFREFRDEYREDMRDLKTSIANIAKLR